MRRRVGIGLRGEVALLQSPHQIGPVQLPRGRLLGANEGVRVFNEQIPQQTELLGLGDVHALVDRIQDFHRLIEHGERRADRNILPSLPDHQFRRPADTTCLLLDVRGHLNEPWRHILVGQRHHVLANGLATRVDPHATAQTHPEAHGVLAAYGL